MESEQGSEQGSDDGVTVDVNAWREAGFLLARPIEQKDGETVERVEFLEPTVAMLKAMDSQKGDVGKAIALIARMTSLSPADVHKLHPFDFGRCQKVAQDFFGEFLEADGSEA